MTLQALVTIKMTAHAVKWIKSATRKTMTSNKITGDVNYKDDDDDNDNNINDDDNNGNNDDENEKGNGNHDFYYTVINNGFFQFRL